MRLSGSRRVIPRESRPSFERCRKKGPRLCIEVENGVAVGAPALLVKADVQPLRSGATR